MNRPQALAATLLCLISGCAYSPSDRPAAIFDVEVVDQPAQDRFLIRLTNKTKRPWCVDLDSVDNSAGYVRRSFTAEFILDGRKMPVVVELLGMPIGRGGIKVPGEGVHTFFVFYENFGVPAEIRDAQVRQLQYEPVFETCRHFDFSYPSRAE